MPNEAPAAAACASPGKTSRGRGGGGRKQEANDDVRRVGPFCAEDDGGVVPTVASAAHAIATARCNRIVREAAPWWVRSGARDASSILAAQLKEIYDSLQRQHVESELAKEELSRLRDGKLASDSAGAAAVRRSAQLSLALKSERLKVLELQRECRREAGRRERAEDQTAAAAAALDAAVSRQHALQRRHNAMREACDEAYGEVAKLRKQRVWCRLQAHAAREQQDASKAEAEARAASAEAEARRRDSVDGVNAALVSEIEQLHLELHGLRAELAQYKGTADTLIFKTDNDSSRFRPRVTAVSVMTNMYKKNKTLERRNTPDQAHNEKIMSQLQGIVSPAKSSSVKSFPNDDKGVSPQPSQTSWARLRSCSAAPANTESRPQSASSLRQTAWAPQPETPRPPSPPKLQRSSSGVSSASKHKAHRKFKPVPKSQSFRGSPHVIRSKEEERRKAEKTALLKKRVNYQPTHFFQRELERKASARSAPLSPRE